MGTKRKEKQESEELVLMEDSNWFNKGSIVEVCLEDEGFRGSWYTATVLRSVSRRSNKVLLEFHTLMSDSKPTSKPLRQFVDVILVRPVPPRESNRGFLVDEEVDAFHNDGWWEGVVTDAYQVGRYSVFFRCSREQIEFAEEDLRLHREWVYGNWVPPLQQPPPPAS
ncbi:hypothetical protein LIER_37535 [Lithospermum erythrorhizon]|uniref:Agenet domain-containing protein n=1 Tax=Lithospermum erythrorhizon TaxID=34254 RepID=A0AAV3PPL6_LITER